ncbi:MAG: tetraacyldisaccharide 4'-kinase [Pirellulaceae bacterium]|jgi:tetraacyldisaccharide 4'-kinase
MSWFDPDYVHQLMSGKRRGIFASILRLSLWTLQWPYGIGARLKNRRYMGGKNTTKVAVPVISVGNITTGGTGKTPMVAWLARWLRNRDIRVTLISRGYGAEEGSRNDEAMELELQLPDVPHIQNPDRIEAANIAIDEFECQVILLDDAFQHRRIHRDLDIVLIDAVEPFGFGHLLPRGLLREPLSGLKRADLIVLSRADAVNEQRRTEIRHLAQKYSGDTPWLDVIHRPQQLISSSGKSLDFAELQGKSIAAFCGIGNPEGFRHTLESCNLTPVSLRAFPDHFSYQRDDVETIAEWARELHAEVLICTRKDIVKLGVDRIGGVPLWALTIGVEVNDNDLQILEAKLHSIIESMKVD